MYGQFDEVRILKKIYEDYDLPKHVLNLVLMMELQIQIPIILE